jgi:hypothetical protein
MFINTPRCFPNSKICRAHRTNTANKVYFLIGLLTEQKANSFRLASLSPGCYYGGWHMLISFCAKFAVRHAFRAALAMASRLTRAAIQFGFSLDFKATPMQATRVELMVHPTAM